MTGTVKIDVATEQLLTLNQAARKLPSNRRDRPVSLSCVLRWILEGVKLPTGETHRLEAVRMGGRWLTSLEALQRFAERQTPHFDDSSPDQLRSATARQKASERAGRELERIGI